jgi:hypothetical protein
MLLPQVLRGQSAQLVVDERQELLGSQRVALLDGGLDTDDCVHRRHQKDAVLGVP